MVAVIDEKRRIIGVEEERPLEDNTNRISLPYLPNELFSKDGEPLYWIDSFFRIAPVRTLDENM